MFANNEKIELIEWDERLRTGISVVDEQHMELIKRVNNVFKHGLENAAISETFETLDFLADYVIMHFKHEEDCMLNAEYHEYNPHKAEHDDFIKKYIDTRRMCMDCTESTDIVRLTANLISVWLIEHINVSDMRMAEYFIIPKSTHGDG